MILSCACVQIYDIETRYLTDANPRGNAVRGEQSFTKALVLGSQLRVRSAVDVRATHVSSRATLHSYESYPAPSHTRED